MLKATSTKTIQLLAVSVCLGASFARNSYLGVNEYFAISGFIQQIIMTIISALILALIIYSIAPLLNAVLNKPQKHLIILRGDKVIDCQKGVRVGTSTSKEIIDELIANKEKINNGKGYGVWVLMLTRSEAKEIVGTTMKDSFEIDLSLQPTTPND